MCNQAANCCITVLKFVPDRYKTLEIYGSVFSEDPFSIRYVPDQCKFQQNCNEAVDNWLADNWLCSSLGCYKWSN